MSVPKPSSNGLLSSLPPRERYPRLQGDQRADVVVVGGGAAGLAAARTWNEARPDDRVLILEASIIGNSGSAAHCGFLPPLNAACRDSWNNDQRLKETHGLQGETLTWLETVVSSGSVTCTVRRANVYLAAGNSREEKTLLRFRTALGATGHESELVSRSALCKRTGSDIYRSALCMPGCRVVQPAKFLCTLADTLPDNVEINEHSRVLHIVQDDGDWRLSTDNGEIATPTAIIANPASVLSQGIGRWRLGLRRVRVGVTVAMPRALLNRLGSDRSWGLQPLREPGLSLRLLEDHRLLISQTGPDTDSRTDARPAVTGLEARLQRSLPELHAVLRQHHQEGLLESCWCYLSGYTRNGSPLWGEMQPGLFVAAGYASSDVVTASVLGRLLARSAMGQPVTDVRWLFGIPKLLPPRVFRSA